MASITGGCIDIRITNLPVELDSKLMYGQCTASTAGWYIDIRIADLPVELGGTLV